MCRVPCVLPIQTINTMIKFAELVTGSGLYICPSFLFHSLHTSWTAMLSLEFQISLENELHLLGRDFQMNCLLKQIPGDEVKNSKISLSKSL